MGDDRPVPEWLLERLARNELPAAEASRLRARLEARGEGGRLQAIERSDREILDAHPPAVVAAEVRRRAGMHRRGGSTWRSTVFSGLALGAAGLAVVFAMGRSPRMVVRRARPRHGDRAGDDRHQGDQAPPGPLPQAGQARRSPARRRHLPPGRPVAARLRGAWSGLSA